MFVNPLIVLYGWSLLLLFVAIPLSFVFALSIAIFRVRLTNWSPEKSDFYLCNTEDPARDVRRNVVALSDLGFAVAGHWEHAAGAPRGSARLVLMEHPQTLVVARVVDVSVSMRRSLTAFLETRFDDGSRIATSNSRMAGAYPLQPGISAVWLPDVRDVNELYRLHLRVADSICGGRKRRGIGPDAATYLAEDRDRVFADWLKVGYYLHDKAYGRFRPTWKGAVLMVLRTALPFRFFVRRARRRVTDELLREACIDPDPE